MHTQTLPTRHFIPAALGMLCMAVSSCAQHPPVKTVAVKPEVSLAATPAVYQIGVGDELEVKFYFVPELNDLLQVRPDGKISLMFAQDVQAAGQTPEQLAEAIKQALGDRVKQNDLVVIVRSFASQKAYVAGEVAHPGPVQLVGGENLTEVLSSAGWVTPAGRSNAVLVTHCCNPDGSKLIYTADLDKITTGQDMAQNVAIHGGDEILVPPSDAVSFDRWVDQYIRQALPFSSSVSAVYTNQNYRP